MEPAPALLSPPYISIAALAFAGEPVYGMKHNIKGGGRSPTSSFGFGPVPLLWNLPLSVETYVPLYLYLLTLSFYKKNKEERG